MDRHDFTVCGLPESGKTTYLAALWHLVTSQESETKLRFSRLGDGDLRYMNAIASRWRDARVQERNFTGDPPRIVDLHLEKANHTPVQLRFPDVSGEAFRRMWETRDCDRTIADVICKRTGMLLFVHSDTIDQPLWVADEVALSRRMGLDMGEQKPVPWHPRLAPTQVQLVDILQQLSLGKPPTDRLTARRPRACDPRGDAAVSSLAA